MFSPFVAVVTLAVALQASALQIYQPSSTWWWQTGDQALLSWDCSDRSHTQYTVMVTNPNRTLLSDATPLVAIQGNDQCNINLVPMLNPGPNYSVHLCNPLNNTDCFANSEPFEVKPKGSPYPTATPSKDSSPSTASASNSQSAQTTGTTGKTGSAPTMHAAATVVGLFAIGISAILA